MHSSDGGINNVSYAHSTTDLNVKTNNTSPSLIKKDCGTVRDSDSELKNLDNNNGDALGCAATYRRFLSDWPSLLLLLFLYVLQGLPLGLITSIPLIIQEKSATYNQQAVFKFASWPFSMKLLWAPLVDALYVKRIGRRKSWLIPVQYVLGITLLVLSYQADYLFDTMQVGLLTGYFFLLNFLAATQDIAVDGWALTMLKSENVGLVATVNQVGAVFGTFIGHVVFLNLASEDFSNNYLRPVPKSGGIVTLSSFMVFWACAYFVTTTLILIFKREGNELIHATEKDNTIVKSYFRLYQIIKLPAVRWYVLFLLTKNFGHAAVNGVSDIKLVEYGLSKETKSLLTVPYIPISIFFPIIISRWTGGHKPMSIWKNTFLFALLGSGLVAVMVWVTGTVKNADGEFPGWYFPILVIVECFFKVCQSVLNLAFVAFSAKITDPDYGSTFMTLYNTLHNLGGVSTQALALWLVDPLTITEPCNDATACDKPTTRIFDGYFIETIACIVIAACWFIWGRRIINTLQKKPVSEFRIKQKRNNDE